MTRLHQLAELGQAVWLDYISRSLATTGQLRSLIEQGVRGVTSNPTIFDKAISSSSDYDPDLQRLAREGKTPMEIYEALALDDIARVADILRPAHELPDGLGGYVSLEVSPTLADDTEGTIAEARRLYRALNRPNVFIKVPATPAGIPAIETLIAEGYNINITLMFSLAQYRATAEAYIRGLERRAALGMDVSRVASVASFFVSRVDTLADQALARIGHPELQGKTAIANTKMAYALFRQTFSGERWGRLAALGARAQRPLWASTSTKNPLFPDTLYVDTLIGPDTVNTMPLNTLSAFMDHGQVALTLEAGMDEARAVLARLEELGISLDEITDRLLTEGVASFAKSFEDLLFSIGQKSLKLTA